MYLNLKKEVDIINYFESVPKFRKYYFELAKDQIYRKKNSICLDIVKVFLDELDPTNEDEFELIKLKGQTKDIDMIVVNLKKDKEKHNPACTKPKFRDRCCCQLKFF